MKVLFLHRHTYENGVGGITEFLHHLPLALRQENVEVILYCEGKASHTPEIMQNGMRVFFGPFPKPSIYTFKKNLQSLIDLCKREKIELIHAQGTYRSGYVAQQLSKHTNIPYLITSHSDIVSLHSDRMKRGKVQRRCANILRKARAVTHLSPYMADISHQIYDTRGKSIFIHNGIDTANWLPYTTQDEQDYVLGIGRLEREKGFHILIDAYHELYKQGAQTSLVIAGVGSAEQDLHAQAKQLGLPVATDFQDIKNIPSRHVVFTGYVRSDSKKLLLSQSKMILFPTQPTLWGEAFGIVQIEAMAAGKPVIASDSETTRYLTSLGLQAKLVQADAVSQWAEQMDLLLKDDKLRRRIGQVNLKNAQRFDWSLIAKQYRELYTATLSTSSSKARLSPLPTP